MCPAFFTYVVVMFYTDFMSFWEKAYLAHIFWKLTTVGHKTIRKHFKSVDQNWIKKASAYFGHQVDIKLKIGGFVTALIRVMVMNLVGEKNHLSSFMASFWRRRWVLVPRELDQKKKYCLG